MHSLTMVDNGFIKTSFLQPTRQEEFQQKWMSAETLAQLIVKYSIVDSSLMFNGEQLDKYINSRENKHLQDEMDLRLSIPKDHIGIFREQQRKKGSTKRNILLLCYYFRKNPRQRKEMV
jgi:hypothetical protein